MPNPHRELAAAVAANITAAELLGDGVTVSRAYLPVDDLADVAAAGLVAYTIPGAATFELMDRRRDLETYVVNLVLQHKLNPSDLDAVDAAFDLLEDVSDYFKRRQITTDSGDTFTCLKREYTQGAPAGFAPEHLDTFRQFTAVLALTFKTAR